jgi:hypothetical protein
LGFELDFLQEEESITINHSTPSCFR